MKVLSCTVSSIIPTPDLSYKAFVILFNVKKTLVIMNQVQQSILKFFSSHQRKRKDALNILAIVLMIQFFHSKEGFLSMEANPNQRFLFSMLSMLHCKELWPMSRVVRSFSCEMLTFSRRWEN